MIVQPYVFFDGRCDEAIEFYKKALGLRVEFLMRFKDAPAMSDSEGCGEGGAPPPPPEKVMHSTVRIGETTLMMSDGRGTGHPKFEGFTLSIALPTPEEAEKIFASVGEGGQVQMPMTETFFSKRFGMVADKFGVSWMILVDSGHKPGADESQVKPFIISREFDAPRDVVWKAWTERDRLMKWFGPKGFTMSTAKLDFRPGGEFLYALRGTDGKEMWGKFVYREIATPERIVFVNSFSDANGGMTRHPMAPTWPREMLSTTTLTEKAGRTTVAIRWTPIDPSPEELSTFNDAHEGMMQGWTGTFEQLEGYLKTA